MTKYEVYTKVGRVIDDCTTIQQLEAARAYVKRFKTMFDISYQNWMSEDIDKKFSKRYNQLQLSHNEQYETI